MLVLSVSLAHAQTRTELKPDPPEVRAKKQRADQAHERGRAFLKQNQLEQAIEAFREVVAIEKTIPGSGFRSSPNYDLAKALTLAKRPEEALAAYKQAFRWDPKRGELDTNGPPFIQLGMDYAIALAKANRPNDAKAVYYSTLRKLSEARWGFEPFPFLVVFDPDPTMTEWELTKENLVAAATMLRAPESGPDAIALTESVRNMKPDWIMPVMYLANRGKDRQNNLDVAMSLARNAEERMWVQEYKANHVRIEGEESKERWARETRLAEIGVARRKASVALAAAKAELKDNWRKVAGSSW